MYISFWITLPETNTILYIYILQKKKAAMSYHSRFTARTRGCGSLVGGVAVRESAAHGFRDEVLGLREATQSVHFTPVVARTRIGISVPSHSGSIIALRQSYAWSHCVTATLIEHLMPRTFWCGPKKKNNEALLFGFVCSFMWPITPFSNYHAVFNSKS